MGASSPYAHLLILEMSNMLQQWAVWCATNSNPDKTPFFKAEYISGIQRYLKVDADDPTCTVNGYLYPWWLDDGCPFNFPSYAFNPHDYLEVHRPQVTNMFSSLVYYQYFCLDSIHMARCMASSICHWQHG